jgi:hypothetical protein
LSDAVEPYISMPTKLVSGEYSKIQNYKEGVDPSTNDIRIDESVDDCNYSIDRTL